MNQLLLGIYNPKKNFPSEVDKKCLTALPEAIRQKIYWHIYDLAGKPSENNYGETHVFDSLPRLQEAIQRIAFETFDSLTADQKRDVGGKVWFHSGSPQTTDDNWYEHHAKDNVPILLRSLYDTLESKSLEAILDEWVQQGDGSELRGQAKHKIITFLSQPLSSENGHRLDLYCLRLKTLPPIFDKEPFVSLLRELNFGGNQLTTLPSAIGQLQALQVLNVSQNQLATLPPEIGQLQALQRLEVSNNRLTTLPTAIGKLQALQKLGVSSNRLITLRSEIGQLQALQRLEVSNNRLTILPPEIGQLQALQSLEVSNNQLTTLPPEIGQLQALQKLVVFRNQMTTLPPEIGQLRALRWLDIRENQLTTLPSEIRLLEALHWLYVSNNQLTALPPEIGQLPALRELIIFNNRLTTLPPEIGQLRALRWLFVSNNQLATLPSEIGQLQALQELIALNNQLTTLPPEIGQLQALKKLVVSRNRLTTLPPEIGQLQVLRWLNLNTNLPLTGVPNALLDLHRDCRIDLTETGLSDAVRNRLRETCLSPDYRGPRIEFSMEQAERVASVEMDTLDNLLKRLKSIAGATSSSCVNLKELLNEEQQTTLRSWLSRLSDTADYKRKGDFQKAFANRVLGYLEEAEKNSEFREIFLNVIMDASATCGDRVSLSILHIDMAAKLAKIDIKNMKLLSDFLIKTVWPVKILETIAQDKVDAMNFVDPIEVYLGYPVMLREKLGLDIAVEDMLYFRCSNLTPKDLDEAADIVQKNHANDEKKCRFLSTCDKWQTACREAYPKESNEMDERNTEESDELNNKEITSDDDGDKAKKAWEERWVYLTAWALGLFKD